MFTTVGPGCDGEASRGRALVRPVPPTGRAGAGTGETLPDPTWRAWRRSPAAMISEAPRPVASSRVVRSPVRPAPGRSAVGPHHAGSPDRLRAPSRPASLPLHKDQGRRQPNHSANGSCPPAWMPARPAAAPGPPPLAGRLAPGTSRAAPRVVVFVTRCRRFGRRRRRSAPGFDRWGGLPRNPDGSGGHASHAPSRPGRLVGPGAAAGTRRNA